MKELAPVVVFAYNRADKVENCLLYLEKCVEAADSDLFIFCDGPKGEKDKDSVERVSEFTEKYAKRSKFKSVSIKRQSQNIGLATSVITGVTEVVNSYGKVIVVEDDLVVKPAFLKYLNEGLRYYENEKKIGSISAFTYPLNELESSNNSVFVTPKAECWGWGTWKDRWDNASWKDTDFNTYLNNKDLRKRFDGLEAGLDRLMVLQKYDKISSWAVRWIYYLFCNGMYTIYPRTSMVVNEGFDGSGTHGIGFARDINDRNYEEIDNFEWGIIDPDESLSTAYAKFPRRRFPLWLWERFIYMHKK